MARENATKTTNHAETVWGAQGFSGPRPRGRALETAWFGRTAFVACAIGLVCLVGFAAALTTAVHDRVLSDAGADLEIVARAVLQDLNEAIARKPASLDLRMSSILPSAAGRGRQIVVTDEAGRVTAATPPLDRPARTLGDVLGADLIGFAELQKAARVTLADGAEALAVIRKLPAPLGQVALIHPIDAVLFPWRAIAWRYALVFAATTAMLLAVVVSYFHQTRRRQAAEKVNDLIRRRLEIALSRGRCGLWDWDITNGCIYWSDSMYELLAMPAERRCLEVGEVEALLHQKAGAMAELAALAASSRSRSVDHEFRVRNAAGEWIWLRARAELLDDARGRHLVGIAVDVSEQHALAEHTATANLRLRDAIETISEAFVLWDAQNRLVTCNSKFLDLHGLTPEVAAPGAAYPEIMAHATAPLIQTEVAPAQQRATAGRTYEVRLLDGRWLQINERRTKDGGYVSVGADITQLKWNEEKLRESERRLTASVADLTKSRQKLEMQAQQLATLAEQYHFQKAEAEAAYLAKSVFLANMNHELRTPLNAVIGFSEMMLEQTYGALGSPKYLEYCHDIHKSGAYLNEVLSDLIDMSELEAGRVRLSERELRVGDVMSAAAERWRQRAAAKSVAITLDICGDLRCSGDRDALLKSLGMLLSNSVKFTAPGGRIRLVARKAGAWLNIFVEDNGCGIEKGAIGRLGRPFEQPSAMMENGMKGSGLGLAIARSLIELHRGRMRIRSRVGVGAIVMVRVPALEAPAVTPRSRAVDQLALRIANRQTFPRSAREAATRAAGSEMIARNPGALSSMRSAP